jgi:hypothetical protein
MDIQTIFYIVAIIVMLTWFVVLFLFATILWTLYTGIKNAPKKIEEAVSNIIENNKSGLMGMVGVTLGSFLLSRIKSWMSK